MLDALVPAVAALEVGGDLSAASKTASAGVDRTASMTKARAGRSSYVREDALRGIADPGAMAIAAVFAALSRDSDLLHARAHRGRRLDIPVVVRTTVWRVSPDVRMRERTGLRRSSRKMFCT
jgi:hypothetical protein